ncbi:MAG: putative replication initiation protein [Microviridae sp.]|nr:MAG: putative replication initiation protein [Microviridae sp.]
MQCDAPLRIERDGYEIVGLCGSCKKCRDNRRRDMIGRCLAEVQDPSCRAVTFVTLTYGHDPSVTAKIDHPHARSLYYEDVQKWLKRIRTRQMPGSKKRYRCRYVAAGEMGSQKGRAHWHCLLFWQTDPPNFPAVDRWSEDPFWSLGFTNWQLVTKDKNHRAVAYVAKYVAGGDLKSTQETCFHGSYRPLLGGAYLARWADRHVEAGLGLTQNRIYQVDGSYKRNGKLFDYFMNISGAKWVARHYLERWKETREGHRPYSRLVEWYEDLDARDRVESIRDDAAIERIAAGKPLSPGRRKVKSPTAGPPRGYESWWDDSLQVFVAVCGDGRPELKWNWKRQSWDRKITLRSDDPQEDPLPDLPGEAPREFRRVADIPDFVPGEPLDLSKRRRAPGSREVYAARKAREYQRELVTGRMEKVAAAIKRLREDEAET